MSKFIQAVDTIGVREGATTAFTNSRGESISYGQLKTCSDNLALWLARQDSEKRPVAVYGHKSPFMLVAFLACVKSGRAYVPLDVTTPATRIIGILEQLDRPIFLSTTDKVPSEFDDFVGQMLSFQALRELAESLPGAEPPQVLRVSGDELFYIIFTSGSTGKPKGVEITAACFDAFWEWMIAEFAVRTKRVYFNRAPFSFDLSVTDLALGLGHGDTLFALELEDELDLGRSFAALAKSKLNFWISTASFADMCLRDPSFSKKLLPQVESFFFVGETLKNSTAQGLMERFGGAAVINGYGPTESTDLVSAVRITKEMAQAPRPLPVGIARPGTVLKILDPHTLSEVPPGHEGELYILGDTVAKGYYRQPELTKAAFHSCPEEIANGMSSYKTGDAAYLDETGMLHFKGRLDFQIKMHGYRIELGDIESNLRRLELVHDACVLPATRNASITHLIAYVVLSDTEHERGLACTRLLKSQLKSLLPEYMIPRKFVYLDRFPLTENGKIDRGQLKEYG